MLVLCNYQFFNNLGIVIIGWNTKIFFKEVWKMEKINLDDLTVEPTDILARWISVFLECQSGSDLQRIALTRIPTAISIMRAKITCCYYNSTISIEDFNSISSYLYSFESNYGLLWDEYYCNKIRNVFARNAPHDLNEHMDLVLDKIEDKSKNIDDVLAFINQVESIDRNELASYINAVEIKI